MSITLFCDVIEILCIRVCDADFELAQTVHVMKIKATVVFIYVFVYLFMICLHIYLWFIAYRRTPASNSEPIVSNGRMNNEFHRA